MVYFFFSGSGFDHNVTSVNL